MSLDAPFATRVVPPVTVTPESVEPSAPTRLPTTSPPVLLTVTLPATAATPPTVATLTMYVPVSPLPPSAREAPETAVLRLTPVLLRIAILPVAERGVPRVTLCVFASPIDTDA
ncbi:conserved hypothetical protein [Ricinus communis]|uniref:Uncharacterized protein n=1 Tax=Ricinus communis TaxID=3988 RepID=B9TDT0_RICCO|nr:conserved hypothetical protein [Ricinus communis]